MILALLSLALGIYLGWNTRSFVSSRSRRKIRRATPKRVKCHPVLNTLQQQVLSALVGLGASHAAAEAAVLSLSDRKHDTFDGLFRAAVSVVQPAKARKVA
jgi:hypothetical protein